MWRPWDIFLDEIDFRSADHSILTLLHSCQQFAECYKVPIKFNLKRWVPNQHPLIKKRINFSHKPTWLIHLSTATYAIIFTLVLWPWISLKSSWTQKVFCYVTKLFVLLWKSVVVLLRATRYFQGLYIFVPNRRSLPATDFKLAYTLATSI